MACATPAYAQSAQSSQQSTQQSDETRPALTSASGTTGIWFVPTAEVLAHKQWSVSFYRNNFDDGQGFSDISYFPATFAVGLGGRAELFGAWTLVTRIDRDTRPLFFEADNADGTGGGILVNHPLVREQWTGNQIGDFRIGGKINLLADSEGPAAVGLRAQVKLPVGDDEGASTGKADFEFDGIVSARNDVAEIAGYAGLLIRGNPDGYELTNGLRWGVGAAFPQRYSAGFRVHTELFGEFYFDDTITAPAGLTGVDGSPVPTSTRLKDPVYASVGVTWQAPNGFFVGAAAGWNLHMSGRDAAGFPTEDYDDKQFHVRLGYHPGARSRLAPPPPPPPPPPAAAPAAAAESAADGDGDLQSLHGRGGANGLGGRRRAGS
jgi:hypothetical protein